MANTTELRRRIKTAQNVSKTTRAMQMIAASKLKRAQSAAVASRPYVTELMDLVDSLAPKNPTQDAASPYMQAHKISGKTLYIFIGPDKGLAGAMISNLLREFLKIRHEASNVYVIVGKKLQGPVAQSGKNLLASFPFGSTLPSFSQVLPVVDIINDEFLSKRVDKVKIIATEFKSVFTQTPRIIDLLPVQFEETKSSQQTAGRSSQPEKIKALDTIFEPSKNELLPELLKRYIEMIIYQQFLENYASFNAAQMIAMQNATNNAKDIVNELQLLYNKARQEKITKEILDISSASVALGTL